MKNEEAKRKVRMAEKTNSESEAKRKKLTNKKMQQKKDKEGNVEKG